MTPSVCMFTAVCEEDRGWLPQYLAEAERLQLPFVMHLDRCSGVTKQLVRDHRLCVGSTMQNDPAMEFNERHKQEALNLVASHGFDWALAMDVDETFERGARPKLDVALALDADQVQLRWLNLWGDRHHVRTDGPFDVASHRVKLYNLRYGRWKFTHPITNGAKLKDGREPRLTRADVVILHHGLMTPELRRMHKERWDRIYSTALQGDPNPYGFWRYACDDSIVPTLEPNVWGGE